MPLNETRSLQLPNATPVRTALVTPAGGAAWEGDRGTVGTATDNAVVLTDETVSRYHLRLVAERDGVRVVDLGSTNGTFLGDVRIVDCVIPKQATLRLGRSLAVVTLDVPPLRERPDDIPPTAR